MEDCSMVRVQQLIMLCCQNGEVVESVLCEAIIFDHFGHGTIYIFLYCYLRYLKLFSYLYTKKCINMFVGSDKLPRQLMCH